ncbi:helix-turn-helix transcriptional regulator [Konateibacter massiliensis]|uniref:helix-turn-helix transcriptional regulator n=1 Tax=Konateibacter massiliensis TaxID=2002841 RepID=UPI000C152FF9|nr:YafY family protein [Konateibacter massiliensis]
MKLDRLIGIITVLLQKGKVTAPYLAEKFEVSRRTIHRDIEDICKAGIPIITLQGSNGGITISEGYKIDKTLFTEEELHAVFVGLSSLDSVAQDKKYQNIIDKFFPSKSEIYASNHILINLSSHYKNSLAPKISDLKNAIEASFSVQFTYCNSSGERQVVFNPYFIVFQWSSWYVFGYDQTKCEFRLFKLNRLWKLQVTGQCFEMQEIPDKKLDFNKYFTDEIQAVIRFDKAVKYRIIDEYGIDSFTILSDKRLQFEFPFTNKEYLIEWVLGFGEKAELIEPKELRMELLDRLKKTQNLYSQT